MIKKQKTCRISASFYKIQKDSNLLSNVLLFIGKVENDKSYKKERLKQFSMFKSFFPINEIK